MASNTTPKPQTQQPSEAAAKAPDAAAGKTVLQPRGLACPATRQRRRRRREQELWAPALLVQKEKKSRTKGNQLYFSSLITVGRGFAVSSMISRKGYVKQGAAADQS